MAAPRSALPALLAAAGLAACAQAAEPSGITRCQTGAEDLLGSPARKAYTVQVCNLFGATCYVNHPSVASANCGTEALSIESGKCKLYPILEYQDNAVRSGGSAVEELSTQADLGCSVSSSNSNYKWSGACVSVQCSLGDGTFAGPGMSGSSSSSSRATGVSNTATATWRENTVASLPSGAKQLKNVFLYRTGKYVATAKTPSSGNSNSISYSVGNLPTSDGNPYGPVACPSRNQLMTSSAATGITAENLRMCGATGKWAYYNAVNLLVDATHYTKYSGDAGSTSDLNLGSAPFLTGKSAYRSGDKMAHARKVMLLSGASSSSTALMTSATITPQTTGASANEVAGTWRSYGVVFYCDDYDRTDLTTCADANRKMFYVGDPNPDAVFGTTASAIGGGGSLPEDGTANTAAPRAAAAFLATFLSLVATSATWLLK